MCWFYKKWFRIVKSSNTFRKWPVKKQRKVLQLKGKKNVWKFRFHHEIDEKSSCSCTAGEYVEVSYTTPGLASPEVTGFDAIRIYSLIGWCSIGCAINHLAIRSQVPSSDQTLKGMDCLCLRIQSLYHTNYERAEISNMVTCTNQTSGQW